MSDPFVMIGKFVLAVIAMVCRIWFEWAGMIFAWYVFSKPWAIVSTVIFVLWQLIGLLYVIIAKRSAKS